MNLAITGVAAAIAAVIIVIGVMAWPYVKAARAYRELRSGYVSGSLEELIAASGSVGVSGGGTDLSGTFVSGTGTPDVNAESFEKAGSGAASESGGLSGTDLSGNPGGSATGSSLSGNPGGSVTGSDLSGSTGGLAPGTAGSGTASAGAADTGIYRYIDFTGLQKVNPDCCGWLYACGGVISYPVVAAQDDETYLTHGLDGETLHGGTIFARADIEEPFHQFETALYGHNMRDGSMFHSLMNYKKADYLEAHPQIYVFTPEADLVYDIFAVVVEDNDALPFCASSAEEDRESFLSDIRSMSLCDTGIRPSAADEILSLITCEYSGANNRLVVYGVKSGQ